MEYKDVEKFREWLISEEKSRAMVDKYMWDIKKCRETIGKGWDKEKLIAYKYCLMETYAPASVNSMLTSVNMFLKFLGKTEWIVKLLKIQQYVKTIYIGLLDREADPEGLANEWKAN